jgi:hypothetical protein
MTFSDLSPATAYYLRFRATNSMGTSANSATLVIVTQPSALRATGQAEDDAIRVYPNPTTGNFNIDLNPTNSGELAEIRVLDASGQPVKLIKRDRDDAVTESIDLNNQPLGIYNLQLIYRDRVINKKIVKH